LSTSGYKIRYLSPNRKLYNFYLGITRDNGTGGFWGVSNCKNDNSVERYSAVNQIPQFSVSGTIADIKVDLDCENVYVCGNQNIRGRYNISTST
jgi:hypothetical protein